MYFGVHWKEDRLILPPPGNNNSGAEWVPIDLDFMQYLWVPNVFVYDIAEFHAIECLKRLAGIWVVKDKELFYNQVSLFLTNKIQSRITTQATKFLFSLDRLRLRFVSGALIQKGYIL